MKNKEKQFFIVCLWGSCYISHSDLSYLQLVTYRVMNEVLTGHGTCFRRSHHEQTESQQGSLDMTNPTLWKLSPNQKPKEWQLPRQHVLVGGCLPYIPSPESPSTLRWILWFTVGSNIIWTPGTVTTSRHGDVSPFIFLSEWQAGSPWEHSKWSFFSLPIN
jgi:hypothetical protein